MICRLSVQDLAIIEKLSIEFSEGFNVITGETGAGKSIIILALNYLAGRKAESDSVRHGREYATVVGEFVVDVRHPSVAILQKLGVAYETAGEQSVSIIVRRVIARQGRSQSFVNDTAVATQSLRELGASLVDIFGQHENQKLLDRGTHTHYVDRFIGDKQVREAFGSANRVCEIELKKWLELVEKANQRKTDLDYLVFRLDEFEKLCPSVEDYQKCELTCRELETRAKEKLVLQEVMDCIDGENMSVRERLGQALRVLSNAHMAEGIREKLSLLRTGVDELSFDLSKSLSSSVDEAELDTLQKRLFQYQGLLRKHHVTSAADLVDIWEKLRLERQTIDELGLYAEQAIGRLEKSAADLTSRSQTLTDARKKAAQKIDKAIARELNELSMQGTTFHTEFEKQTRQIAVLAELGEFGLPIHEKWQRISQVLREISSHGAERAFFQLSANPGEPLLPLEKVASGGELSRIMLAIKKTLLSDADTCVLVFDEIDTGISGKVADTMGRKLKELSHDFQVICITHLAQVAVHANTHLLVQKKSLDKRTQTEIVRLNEMKSVKEIARLLSGDELVDSSFENARSLLRRAAKKKTTEKPIDSRII